MTEALNEYLKDLRARRAELAKDEGLVHRVLADGVEKARAVAIDTLDEVRQVMNMTF